MSEWVGVVGTLGGVLIGSIGTWIIQVKALEHAEGMQRETLNREDARHVQAMKVRVYSSFCGLATKAISAWQTGQPTDVDSINRFMGLYDELQFTAPTAVRVRFHDVHTIVRTAIFSNPQNTQPLVDQFNVAMAEAQIAGRQDLGIA